MTSGVYKRTKAHNLANSKSHLGEKNGRWMGDKVKYSGLHKWIKKHKKKPKWCEDCKKVPPYDLSNKSGKYKRDVKDWEYLCRRCHMIKDGRMFTNMKYVTRRNFGKANG